MGTSSVSVFVYIWNIYIHIIIIITIIIYIYIYMEVSINGGIPKWMVYNGTSQSKMDDAKGYTHDLGNLHMSPFEDQQNWDSHTPKIDLVSV